MKKQYFQVGVSVGVAGLILASGYYTYRHLKQMRNESKKMVHQGVVPTNEQRVESEARKEIVAASVPNKGHAQGRAAKNTASKKTRKQRMAVNSDDLARMIELSTEHTNKDVAKIMGYSEVTVNRYLSKARKAGKCPSARRSKMATVKVALVNNNYQTK